jgi:hypothetical protein
MAGDGRLEIAPRLALQPVGDAAGNMRRLARHGQELLTQAGIEPHKAAAGAVGDPAGLASQRELGAVGERLSARATAEPALQPADVLSHEALRLRDRSPRRERDHRLP